MSENPRVRRLADRIQVIIAKALDNKVKDPRLGFVTVTDVRVSGDMQHATVFYTVLGTDEEREGTAAALKSATGMLRSEVGRNIDVRLTPSLEFIADAIPENARTIEDLLVEARYRDSELSRSQQGATYAGDADPYRTPHDRDAPRTADAPSDEDSADEGTEPGEDSRA